MSELAANCTDATGQDLELLQAIARGMAITADLSRSDLLLVSPRPGGQVAVLAQAQPHSIASLYSTSLVGNTLTSREAPLLYEAFRRRTHFRAHRDLLPSGAPVVQEIFPIPGRNGQPLALLSLETSLIQLERHRQRHPSFQRAIEWLKGMCIRGEGAKTAGLSPFGEWDGILLVDGARRITYLNGIANNLYRRLGYLEDLRGKRLSFLNTADDRLVAEAILARSPLEREVNEGTHVWIRKVIPIWAPPTVAGRLQRLMIARQSRVGDVVGAIVTVHDATDERLKKQELKAKTTMIQEVHHRVKNNLQAIAAMLRMQARRTENSEALHVLREATARILSMAVIHEFLSLDESQTINMRDVCQRIIQQNREVVVTPGQEITFGFEGPSVYLPSQRATAFALVVNELIQNALEHGFENKTRGQVRISLDDQGDRVHLEIWDDGTQLPAEFDLASSGSLGLQIVQNLAQYELRGDLHLENRADGVVATVDFPKS